MTFLVQTAFAIFCCLAVHAACFVPSSCSCSDTESKFGFSFAVGTAETGVGVATGVAVGLHGCDQAAAGWMKMVTGMEYDTLTSSGMHVVGIPRDVANIVDAGISIVGTAGIGAAVRIPAAQAKAIGVSEGSKIYRIWGGESSRMGHSWTTVDPASVKNVRSGLGLSDVNEGTHLTTGVLQDLNGVSFRAALPLDGNPGGLTELLIPNPCTQVITITTSGNVNF